MIGDPIGDFLFILQKWAVAAVVVGGLVIAVLVVAATLGGHPND